MSPVGAASWEALKGNEGEGGGGAGGGLTHQGKKEPSNQVSSLKVY